MHRPIGDAERWQTVVNLSSYMHAGHLTPEQFEERTQKAFVATSKAELDALMDGLPVDSGPLMLPWRAADIITGIGLTILLAISLVIIFRFGS